MIPLGGFPGAFVLGLGGRFGVTPSQFAVGGDFASPLSNDADLPADAATEFVWVPRSLPASGVMLCDDLGGMEHTGAADGTYLTIYDGYAWPPGGPMTVYVDTYTTIFGAALAGWPLLRPPRVRFAGAAPRPVAEAGAERPAVLPLEPR